MMFYYRYPSWPFWMPMHTLKNVTWGVEVAVFDRIPKVMV